MDGNTAHPPSVKAMLCNTYILLDKIKKSHFGTLVSQQIWINIIYEWYAIVLGDILVPAMI